MKKPPKRKHPVSTGVFLVGCVATACVVVLSSSFMRFSVWVLGAEVLATVIALFGFGSLRHRLSKNVIALGGTLVVIATFFTIWWPESHLKLDIELRGYWTLFEFAGEHFFSFAGLNELVHVDTMLFLLGLTFFVSLVAQSRLLESASFFLLEKTDGRVAWTVGLLMAFVSLASGFLDGVSLIGLLIRVLIIILVLTRTSRPSLIAAVLLATVVTTVCGMWLAYGEPPNLILKANLEPHLDNAFFLTYCAPMALGSFLVVAFHIYRALKGKRLIVSELDVLDRRSADVRFYQAARHGAVFGPLEAIEKFDSLFPKQAADLRQRLLSGEPLGAALWSAEVSKKDRAHVLGHYVSPELSDELDGYYKALADGRATQARDLLHKIDTRLAIVRERRLKVQGWTALAFLPFLICLIGHANNHALPLFWSSMSAFALAYVGFLPYRKMRKLAIRNARHEFREYLFLVPLFFSVSLLQKAGFFAQLLPLLQSGVERWGVAPMAYAQFLAAVGLSGLFDNNVAADIAGRALHGFDVGLIHLFAAAQIAGYAIGGCWTSIGSAQSVVAFSYIQQELDERYTPGKWMRAMTPLVLQLGVVISVLMYLQSLFWTRAS